MTTEDETFDYIIIGAGAAGAVLARRLAEDSRSTVCVLESGPPDRHPYLHVPAGFIKVLFDPDVTWQFSSEATAHTGGRRIPLPQGRTLGGSTSINGLVYNRGQREDFDEWADRGNRGWSFADVLPYFRRSERWEGPDPANVRGRDGPMPVTPIDWRHPVCEAFLAGARELGMPTNPDYNGATQTGAGYFQRTIHRGWRMSTARTFLRPVRANGNVVVRTNAQVVRIVFSGTRARGVEYVHAKGTTPVRTVSARKEVIVCAGAINTPKLLQLSGIGPGPLLQSLGIPVVAALPGVGKNLRDHFSVRVVARAKNVTTINELSRAPRLWAQVARWVMKQPSILALSPSLVHYFWHSRPGLTRPDLQGVFSPASYREGYVGVLDTFPGMTCGVWQHRPASAGTVEVRSRDPLEAPRIQPNYLAEEDDRRVLLDGVRLARRLLETQALSAYVDGEAMPGPQVTRDDELLDFIRRVGVSSYHLNGTARMGPASDAGSVVDAELRVRGTAGLRVVDASVMPTIPSANTCAATMMIAEKAADMIRASRD
ncbi:MAG: FAD-dependent oxidoreductase [Betaproteobacteria bacterium]|nr:FAD-dependent oxidoreductase [Betaproteobacteria bacterium]